MDKLPPLPKGYMLAPEGMTYKQVPGSPPALFGGIQRWHRWGDIKSGDWTGFGDFAIPKPRYTCPLEKSDE